MTDSMLSPFHRAFRLLSPGRRSPRGRGVHEIEISRPNRIPPLVALLGVAVLLMPIPLPAQMTPDPLDTLDFELPDEEPSRIQGDTAPLDPGPDYRRRIELAAEASKLWAEGYPKPERTDLENYNQDSVKQVWQTLQSIKTPCEKAIYLKHALDAAQDDYVLFDLDNLLSRERELLAEVMIDITMTRLPTNPFDIAKALKDLAVKPTTGLSEFKFASSLLNLATVVDAVSRIPRGSLKGHIGRFKFAAYERARRNAWSPEQIVAERRRLQAENQRLSSETRMLLDGLRKKAEKRMELHLQRMSSIDEDLEATRKDLAADKANNGEYVRRLKRLQDPDFVETLIVGADITKGYPQSGQHQIDKMDEYLAEDNINLYYHDVDSRAQQNALIEKMREVYAYNEYVLLLGKTTNAEMSKRLAEMELITAQDNTLKDYAIPVAAGDCEKLRIAADSALRLTQTEAAMLDRIKELDRPRFDALMEHVGAKVPENFYACLCARSGTPGAGGGLKYTEGKCWAIGVLGGAREVRIVGHGNSANWKYCLDKVPVTTPRHPNGARMQDILIDKLRTLPGRKIETAQ